MRNQQPLHVSRDVDVHQQGTFVSLHLTHGTDSVDMALHEMSAEPIAEFHRPLEVHSRPDAPPADGGSLERSGYRCHDERITFGGAHGQTGAVHSDTFSELQIAPRRPDAELPSRISVADRF